MNVLDILKDMRTRLDKPEHWTQGASGRHANGVPTYGSSKMAVCWCLVGAEDQAIFALGGLNFSYAGTHMLLIDVHNSLEGAISALGYPLDKEQDSVVSFNDSPGRTHAEVLQVLDYAIGMESDK